MLKFLIPILLLISCSNDVKTNSDPNNKPAILPINSIQSIKILTKSNTVKTGSHLQRLLKNQNKCPNIDDDDFFSKYPDCSKLKIMQKIIKKTMDTLDTTNLSLKNFYSKHPDLCGREVIAILFVNPECEIIGYKLKLFEPSNHCQTYEDFIINPEIEKEYKSAFKKWLNGIIKKDSHKVYKDTLFYYYATRIGDR